MRLSARDSLWQRILAAGNAVRGKELNSIWRIRETIEFLIEAKRGDECVCQYWSVGALLCLDSQGLGSANDVLLRETKGG